IRWEYRIPDDVRNRLVEMGHAWEEEPTEIGNVNSLMFDEENDSYLGAADSTREGMAIGVSTPSISYLTELIEQFDRFEDITDENTARLLKTHLTAVGHFKDREKMEKALKHLETFNEMIETLHEQKRISNQAFDDLKANADYLVNEWNGNFLK